MSRCRKAGAQYILEMRVRMPNKVNEAVALLNIILRSS